MKYYLTNNGQQSGPFELHELLLNGLNAQSYVWNETMTNWAPAMQVPEVAALLQQQTQPPYGQPYQQPAYGQPQQPYQQPAYGQPQPGYQQPYQQAYQQPMRDPKEVGFVDALKICFSKYVDFTGRARRSEFWYFVLWNTIFSLVTCGIANIVFFIPSIAVTFRRLHDTGRSGWWYGGGMIGAGIFYIILLVAIFNGASRYSYGYGGVDSALAAIGIVAGVFYILLFIWAITMFVFSVMDSQPGDNKYGPNPKY